MQMRHTPSKLRAIVIFLWKQFWARSFMTVPKVTKLNQLSINYNKFIGNLHTKSGSYCYHSNSIIKNKKGKSG